MRIIAGTWRGRRLTAPSGLDTRPTADRTRETLFSMLSSRIGSFDGLRVADLFAGTGALGFEALSRGAAHCTFVETNEQARRAILANARMLGCDERIRVVAHSALSLPDGPPFDLILADPPYAPALGDAVVTSVVQAGWLAPGGWLALETKRGDVVDPAGLHAEAARDTGRARLTLMHY